MYKKGSILLLIRLFGAVALFLVNVFIARYYGAATYGDFAYLISLATIFSFLVCAGLDVYLKKQSALNKGSADETRTIHHRSTIISFFTLALVAIPIWILLAVNFRSEYSNALLPIVLVMVYLLSQQKIINGWLIGTEQPFLESFLSRIAQPVFFGVFSSIAIYLPFALFQAKYIYLIFSYSIAVFVVVMFAGYKAYKRIDKNEQPDPKLNSPEILSNNFSFTNYVDLLKLSAPFAFLSATTIVERNIDVMMLSWLNSNLETGMYYACTRISALFLIALFAMNAIASPIVARANKSNDMKRLQATVRRVTLASSVVSAILLVIVVFFGKNLVGLFGFESNNAYLGLLILSTGNFIRTLVGPVFLVATMGGLEKYAFKISSFSVLMNVLLNLLLIPSMGLIGAALATVSSRIVRSVIMHRKIKHDMGVTSGFLSAPKLNSSSL